MHIAPISFTAVTPGSQTNNNHTAELESSFDNMIDRLTKRGAGNDYVQQLRSYEERYIALLSRAAQDGGDAKHFIRSLNADERAVLQHVSGLADPITDSNIAQMTDEGAENLLRMRGEGRDTNKDGFIDEGIARGVQFPTVDTPANVRKAWQAAMDALPMEDRLTAEGLMLTSLMTLDLQTDANGNVISGTTKMQPFSAGFSYQAWAQRNLDYLEAFKSAMNPANYDRDKLFASTFLANLEAEGAA